MTKEEKELVLKDLCARLPFGVKVLYWHHKNGGAEHKVGELVNVDLRLNCDELVFRINQYYFESDSIATSKPYLRPMSSMTEEEALRFEGFKMKSINSINVPNSIGLIDWLIKNHFDYRNLIEKKLALEAPKDMYK